MKSFLPPATCLLLLASSRLALAANISDLDSIPLVEGAATAEVGLDALLEEADYIDNSSNKTIELELKRQRSHQEVVQSHIFKNHMKVMADRTDGATQTSSDGKYVGEINFALDEEHGMYYSTNVYVGSEKQELRVAFSTSSTISVINAKDCTGCARNTGFDFMSSFSIHKIVDKHLRYLIGGYLAQGVLV